MVQKSLRKKLLIDSFNRNYDPNNNNKISEYLLEREGKLVRAVSSSFYENGFGWKVYRGIENEIHKFVEYDWNISVIESSVPLKSLRIDSENNIIINDPSINRYSIHSELGMKEIDIINKSGFMESTSM